MRKWAEYALLAKSMKLGTNVTLDMQFQVLLGTTFLRYFKMIFWPLFRPKGDFSRLIINFLFGEATNPDN